MFLLMNNSWFHRRWRRPRLLTYLEMEQAVLALLTRPALDRRWELIYVSGWFDDGVRHYVSGHLTAVLVCAWSRLCNN